MRLARILLTNNTFEIPSYYQNAFYLANSSFHDNINWYFYRAVEAGFNRLVENVTKLIPSYDALAPDIVRDVVTSIEPCSHVIQLMLPLKRETGRIDIVPGYSVCHGNLFNSVQLSGIRFDGELEKATLRGLASLGTYTNACIGIPFGGSHIGIVAKPDQFSRDEMQRVIGALIRSLYKFNVIGPKASVLKPEFNCSSELMVMVHDEYSKIIGREDEYTCVTGRPYHSGGMLNYEQFLSKGIFIGADMFLNNEKLMEKLNLPLGWQGKTYIIKGLGKMGFNLASIINKHGAKCIGICEKDVSYFKEEGINLDELAVHKSKHGTFLNFDEPFNPNKIMYQTCDIMVISAAHKTLTYFNAPKIRAKIIIEAASGAVTPSAHCMMVGHNILIIPDIIIGAGPAIASFIENFVRAESEKSQKSYAPPGGSMLSECNVWKEDSVTPMIYRKMEELTKDVVSLAEELNLGLDIRTAAYYIAIEKIINSIGKTIGFNNIDCINLK